MIQTLVAGSLPAIHRTLTKGGARREFGTGCYTEMYSQSHLSSTLGCWMDDTCWLALRADNGFLPGMGRPPSSAAPVGR